MSKSRRNPNLVAELAKCATGNPPAWLGPWAEKMDAMAAEFRERLRRMENEKKAASRGSNE
jgi:hypothetical protein